MGKVGVGKIFLTAIAAALSTGTLAEKGTGEPWRNPDSAAVNNWKDLRFGMFICWGPCTLGGHEISWSRGREVPIEVYDNLYKKFNPVKFDADAWVDLAKETGVKYIVLITKHHDGFCLWDSEYTDYDIMNTPFKRDVVKELSDSCRKQGIAFGVYYSTCDWTHPGFEKTGQGGKVQRPNPDMDAYEEYLKNQTAELITKYGPLLTIWNDTPQTYGKRGANTIKLVRELQPDILINDRTGVGGDYDTPELKIGGFEMDRPWESCATLSSRHHWSWWSDKEDQVHSLSKCINMLVRTAGGDGNLLLDIAPNPLGEISKVQADRCREIGEWMGKYGESIHGTRGGPYEPSRNVASTRKGNTAYIHILSWPEETIRLPPLSAGIVKSSLLSGGLVDVKQTEEGVEISIPPEARQKVDTIVKLELDRPALELESVSITGMVTAGRDAKASNIRGNGWWCRAHKALDDKTSTRWATDDHITQGWLEVDLGKLKTFDRVFIEEYADKGGRVKSFELQAGDGEEWKTFYKGGTIGKKLEAGFDPVTARVVRLEITDSEGGPSIREFQLFEPRK